MVSKAIRSVAGVFAAVFSIMMLTSFQGKSDRQLPPLTHSGQNILACRVNGNVNIAAENKNDPGGASEVNFNVVPDKEMIYLSAVFVSPRYDIEISFEYADTPGTYPIVVNYPYFGYFWDYTKSLSPNDSNQYQPDAMHTATINVSFFDGNIISGTFQMDAVNRQGKVVHITDGRFDIARH